MSIQVDAAVSGAWDKIGQLITASGREDASGFRRAIASRLAAKDWHYVECALDINREQAEALRAECAAEWGEPE